MRNNLFLEINKTKNICFCLTFDCYSQNVISRGETGQKDVPPFSFQNLLIFCNVESLKSFDTSWANSYTKFFCTRYQVLFYFWQIKPLLKHSKWPKYYEQGSILLTFYPSVSFLIASLHVFLDPSLARLPPISKLFIFTRPGTLFNSI